MIKNSKIPQTIQKQALQAVSQYNQENNAQYVIHFRGSFAYLERMDESGLAKIGRLKYQPKTRRWDFAVFKYSSERYDPDEWFFPGNELLDGTVEGAMKAGMKIYPPSSGFLF